MVYIALQLRYSSLRQIWTTPIEVREVTGGNLLVSRDRLAQMGQQSPKLHALRGADVVLGSSVLFNNTEDPRFKANLAAARDSARTGVPHLYMVDSTSHHDVFGQLAQAGAIAVLIDHDTEGGLARPYVIAAQLVGHFAGEDAVFVKLEGDKNLQGAGRQNIANILHAAITFDVITGARSLQTMLTMAPYQRVTEGVLATALRDIADVPYDVASGVLALTGPGRELFYQFSGTDWSYLIRTPRDAKAAGVPVGGVELEFSYDPVMVKAELDVVDKKRRDQLEVMLSAAVTAAGGLDDLGGKQRQAYHSALAVLDGLEGLARHAGSKSTEKAPA